jgi:cytochrome c-type biogenesis protein CcmI
VEYLFGALLVVAVVAFVALPLVRRTGGSATTVPSAPESAEERTTIYRELIELELDHRIGKIAEADFHEQRDGLLARAAALIAVEDAAVSTADDQIEREIAATRAALRASRSASVQERQP